MKGDNTPGLATTMDDAFFQQPFGGAGRHRPGLLACGWDSGAGDRSTNASTPRARSVP